MPWGGAYESDSYANANEIAQIRSGSGPVPQVIDLTQTPWRDGPSDLTPEEQRREEMLSALGGPNRARLEEIQRMFDLFGIDRARAPEFSRGHSGLTWVDAAGVVEQFIASDNTSIAEVVALHKLLNALAGESPEADVIYHAVMRETGWDRFVAAFEESLRRLGYDQKTDIDSMATEIDDYGPDDWWNWWSTDDTWAERYWGAASDERRME